MKKYIVRLLLFGFNFSICTGGFLSTVAVSTANATGYVETVANMSSADASSFLCAFATPARDLQSTERTEYQGSPVQVTSCSKEYACITQTNSIKQEDRMLLSTSTKIFEPALDFLPSYEVAYVPFTALKKEGPLFGDAKYYPRVIVKRE